uniref:Uncharacterized protein n=1 Tax=Anguilla anguilla TaxID=7936 RepID=A0A0E9VJI8_ANGAN
MRVCGVTITHSEEYCWWNERIFFFHPLEETL